MKIAVIADIHANAVALDAVLADIERARDRPDRIVCLGDLPALNPQPREVMARIRALGCPTVRGNVDDRIPRHLADPETALAFRSSVAPLTDETARRLREIEFWCAAQLTEAEHAWLLALPLARLAARRRRDAPLLPRLAPEQHGRALPDDPGRAAGRVVRGP